MTTASILILLTIFVTYVVGFDYWGSDNAVQNQKDKLVTFRAEPLYGDSSINNNSDSIVDYLTRKLEGLLADRDEAVRLNMFQFVTNNGCYFYERGPWFPYLNDFISAELRLQLSNWCAKYTKIVAKTYKKN